MVALFIWHLILLVITLTGIESDIIFFAIIIIYILIILSLSKLSGVMDEIGYLVKTTQCKVANSTIVKGIIGLLLIGIIAGNTFFGSYKMDWKEISKEVTNPEVERISKELSEKGFPQYVLEDLDEEEILKFDGALEVAWESHKYPVPGRRKMVPTERNYVEVIEENVFKAENIEYTGIAVKLPSSDENGWDDWRIVHYYRWITNPSFRGTEAIEIYRDGREPPFRYSFPEAEEDGETWINQRAYLTYDVKGNKKTTVNNSWAIYTHQSSKLNYPALSAKYGRISDDSFIGGDFYTLADNLQVEINRENR